MSNEPLTDIHVKLIGRDGNAFAILAFVRKGFNKAIRACENKEEKDRLNQLCTQCLDEATKGDYDNLLGTVMKYVTVE